MHFQVGSHPSPAPTEVYDHTAAEEEAARSSPPGEGAGDESDDPNEAHRRWPGLVAALAADEDEQRARCGALVHLCFACLILPSCVLLLESHRPCFYPLHEIEIAKG